MKDGPPAPAFFLVLNSVIPIVFASGQHVSTQQHSVCAIFSPICRIWLGSQSHSQHSENNTDVNLNTVSALPCGDYLDCAKQRERYVASEANLWMDQLEDSGNIPYMMGKLE